MRYAFLLVLVACQSNPVPRPPQKPAPAPAEPRAAEAIRIYVSLALEAYRAHCGGYPTTEQGLAALFTRPTGAPESWKGPYLDGKPPVLDPWGREFAYRSDGRTFALASAGADGTLGTSDDIGGQP